MTQTCLLAHDHSELDSALAGLVSALTEGDAPRIWNGSIFSGRASQCTSGPKTSSSLLRIAEASRGSTPASSVPESKEIRNLVAQLRKDHDFFVSELTSAVKQLRVLCRSDQSAGLREVGKKIEAVRHRLDMHNALEESRVCRWAALLLNPPEQLALNGTSGGNSKTFRSASGNHTRTADGLPKIQFPEAMIPQIARAFQRGSCLPFAFFAGFPVPLLHLLLPCG
jgi:hypothetical protein